MPLLWAEVRQDAQQQDLLERGLLASRQPGGRRKRPRTGQLPAVTRRLRPSCFPAARSAVHPSAPAETRAPHIRTGTLETKPSTRKSHIPTAGLPLYTRRPHKPTPQPISSAFYSVRPGPRLCCVVLYSPNLGPGDTSTTSQAS